MFGLKGRQDGFRLLLPKEFLVKEVEEKYSEIIKQKLGYFNTPIDFLNESIQKVNVLGFQDGTVEQNQPATGRDYTLDPNRKEQNKFQYGGSNFNYRNAVSPISLTDRTFNITFRHTLGYLNYFLLFENFWYMYTRDRTYFEGIPDFSIDIMNEKGAIYSRIVLSSPIISGMDMLDLDYTQPVAQSQSFKVEFKYSNIDFQFIETENVGEVLIEQ